MDSSTFVGSPRAVREALFALDRGTAPAFLLTARRHWNTLWLAALRAERSLAEPVTEHDARLCLQLAESVFRQRTAGLQ